MESREGKWELDNDDIASVTSEELHLHRPNRWTGPNSTWRTLTEEERLLWQSMKQLQDQDLGVHLYNAFALKKRGQNEATAQDLVVRTEDGKDIVWAPPKIWTAWPLKERQVPKNQLLNPQHDEDESFTFRRQEQILPSTELEGELTASILRTATKRFRKRKSRMIRPSIEEAVALGVGDIENEKPTPSSREAFAKLETEEDTEDEVDEDERVQRDAYMQGRRARQDPKTYEPVESANDDLSCELLRPSVRHILSQLDTTLTILHNSRTAGLKYLSESSTEDESDSQTGPKRPRGRPRKGPTQPIDTDAPTSPYTPIPAPSARRRGRPRKVHTPRDGETEEEMLVRVARESHRQLPVTPKERDLAFEEWMRRGDEEIERERSLSLARQEAEGVKTDGEDDIARENIERKRMRWGLGDWSDVLGAAALAGFPNDVIARATQRCSNLFGQGMVVRRLNEVPVSQGTGIETKEYRPEPIRLSDSVPSSDSSDQEAQLTQRRITSRQASRQASRQTSLARSSQDFSSPPRTPRGRRSHTRSPAPSRSGSSTAGLFFCPMSTCDRSAQGFTRRANLRRHMDLVHQGRTEEVDSDEETMGGVHVDGFLRKIVPGRGWRGEDVNMRRRKRHYRERRFDEGDDENDSSS